MCWYAYIATSKPLTHVRFSKDLPQNGEQPPPLHFNEVSEGEGISLSFFTGENT